MNEDVKFNLTAHRKLWEFLARYPVIYEDDNLRLIKKEDYFLDIKPEEYDKVLSNCYACDYVNKKNNNDKTECEECPLIWNKDNSEFPCYDPNGDNLYGRWIKEIDPLVKSEIAFEIANLPVKKGVETI